MQKNETLNHIIDLIEKRQLGRAVNALENYLLAHPKLKSDMEQILLCNCLLASPRSIFIMLSTVIVSKDRFARLGVVINSSW